MTETRDDTLTWLTQEAYDRLKAELDHLSGPGRVEIAKKIEAAREEGDLKENGGYHAAKDQQGMQEARIRQLTYILENARVGEPPRTDGVVGPGMTVTVRFQGDDEEVTFLLASREESGSPIDVYSPKSPLGRPSTARRSARRPRTACPTGGPRRWRSSTPCPTSVSSHPQPRQTAPAARSSRAGGPRQIHQNSARRPEFPGRRAPADTPKQRPPPGVPCAERAPADTQNGARRRSLGRGAVRWLCSAAC